MPSDTKEQIEILTKELEKAKLLRDAEISKVSHEKALIELEGQTAKAQAERQKALIDLEGVDAISVSIISGCRVARVPRWRTARGQLRFREAWDAR